MPRELRWLGLVIVVLAFFLGMVVGSEFMKARTVPRLVLEERIEWMYCGLLKGPEECREASNECFWELYGDDLKELFLKEE